MRTTLDACVANRSADVPLRHSYVLANGLDARTVTESEFRAYERSKSCRPASHVHVFIEYHLIESVCEL